MKKLLFLFAIILTSAMLYAQVEEVELRPDGIVVPRLDHATVVAPTEGQLVFDINTQTYWYFADPDWIDMAIGSALADTDGDTYVKVEKSSDSDVIHFGVAGHEPMFLDSNHLHLVFGGNSVFIGKDAGMNDDGTGNFNIALGYEALLINDGGWANTGIGYQTLKANQLGNQNSAFGTWAMRDNLANQNTAMGFAAMRSTTSGNWNVAIGHAALHNNMTGYSNVALGIYAAEKSIAWRNVSIGADANRNNTNGFENVIMGSFAADLGNAGSQNTIIGTWAGRNNRANNQTFIGFTAGERNTTGIANTYVGYFAGHSNQTGAYNTTLGYEAGRFMTNGNNTLIGMQAGLSLINGESNTALGSQAGYNAKGDSSIYIGNHAGYNETTSHKLYIANSSTINPLIYGEFNNDLLRVNGDFQVHSNSNEVMTTSYNTTDSYGEVTIKDILTLTPRSTAPTVTSNGMVYYDSDDDKIYFWNGTAWKALAVE